MFHDFAAFRRLNALNTTTAVTAEEFNAEFNVDGKTLCFTFPASDGVDVELMPGGAEQPVTFTNYKEFVNAAFNMRLKEFDAAAAAMRRGLV